MLVKTDCLSKTLGARLNLHGAIFPATCAQKEMVEGLEDQCTDWLRGLAIFWWGGGLPHEVVGAEIWLPPSKPREEKLLG